MSDETKLTESEAANVPNDQVEANRALIKNAEGIGGKLWAFTRLSGPGWLQSAITLGGGSLAGSLYLGVLAGFGAMFWQPLAMIMGVIMLSAIGYVTLSTGERPFDAINKHVNPVLGWGWAIATLMANVVWCMPQYGLGTAALRQNLMPGVLGGETSQYVAIGILFVVTGIVILCYDAGGIAVKIFDWILKGMVGIVVISFFAVVVRMSFDTENPLPWGEIFAGFVPDFSALWRVSPKFDAVLGSTLDYRDFWETMIQNEQRNAMIASAATAVGINMTFLLPYSMLRKGWDRDFRGLAIFDLSTGLFIPYLLATSCVVIASASSFHAQEAPGLVEKLESGEARGGLVAGYNKILASRVLEEYGRTEGAEALAKLKQEQAAHDAEKKSNPDLGPGPVDELTAERRDDLPQGDKRIAAMIVKRDTADFAASLSRLSGASTAQKIFGIGVLGMAVSTIIILMLINGFVLTEICNQPGNKVLHLVGCFIASIAGAYGSANLWTGDAKAYLAVPTSMFGMVLLPIAYTTFFLMLNSKSLVGDDRPSGAKLVVWNVLMGLATAFATFCCLWSVNSSAHRMVGFGALGGFLLLAVVVHFVRGGGNAGAAASEES